MGYPMARNLCRSGNQVAVWSHSKDKVKKLTSEEKAIACNNAEQVAEQADFIFQCVGNSHMSEEVLLGPKGVIQGVKPDAVVVDASTISPAVSREIGKKFGAKKVHFLDAPCTGSKPGAENGTLTFMIGGEKPIFERAKPYFELMGKQFYFCGGPGMGLQAKLTQNLILSNLMNAFSEGLVLSTKAGVDPELMLDILNNSAAKSGLIAFKAPFVFRRDFSTNFSTKWMHKDVSLALDSASELNVPLPLTGLTQQIYQAAIAMGYGDLDMCSAIRVIEQWAGVEVKSK